MHEIKLECNDLSHAIKLEDGRFVVCHGWLWRSKPTVSIVRCAGKRATIDMSFPDEHGSAEIPLNWPSYLAVLKNRDVIVADLLSNRLLLLDSKLKLKKKIVSSYKQEFRGPQKICAHETKLAVVITGGGPTPENDSTENYELQTSAEETSPLVQIITLKVAEQGEQKDGGVEELCENAKRKYEAAKKKYEDLKKRDKEANMIDMDDAKQIDEDCILLVFDIKSLLPQQTVNEQ